MRILFTSFVFLLLSYAHAQGTVCDQLQAGFTFSENTTTLYFSNTTTGTGQGTQFFWDFGDGTTSQYPQPVHTYQPSTYQVCLTALTLLPGANGQVITCVDTTCTVITINAPQCDPNFAVELAWNEGTGGQVFFTATSTEPNTWYSWYFGNQGTANGSSATWTFPQPGNYGVCVTGWYFNEVTNDTCVTEDCAVITVGGNNPCAALNAGFTPSVGGLGVNLQNAVVNNTWTYLWSFGDGATGYGPNTGHQYDTPGVYDICLTVYTWDPVAQDTCFVELCQEVIIGGLPCSPNFLVEMDAQSQGNGLFTFVATSTFPNTNFIWYFGDGTQAFGPTANHVYAEDGTYGVCVMGWYYNEATQDTCWIEDCEPVVVSGTPCNGLEACFVTNDLGNGLYFFDNCSSQNGSAQYFWDFGDGGSSTATNVDHLYEPGVYSVCLVVYEGNCVDSTCTTITIAGPCNSLAANFGWSLTDGLAEFNNVTVPVGLSTTWLWNFGDGSTSTENSPSHLYTAPGSYQACLTATSYFEGGYVCADTYCVTVVVQGEGPCDPNFAVELAWNTGPINTVFLNGTSNVPETYFIWYLGDGSEAYGPSVTHTYAQPGTYTVCMAGWYNNIVTGDSCWAEDCTIVVVGGGDPCDVLNACFVTNDLGNGAYFFDNCTSSPSAAQFFWTFGDGATSGGTNVDHQFSEPGTYQVCLTAFWQQCADTTCTTVTVPDEEFCDLLVACFEPLPFENGAYLFENCSDVLPIDIPWTAFWDFGDGSTSTEQEPTHAFAPGIYTVCLVMTHGDCVDSTCTTITVNSGGDCDPNYSASFTYEVQNNAVIFFANTNEPTLGWIWSFPDGMVAYEPIHTHLFEPPGPFEVCLSTWYWNQQTQDTCWAHTCQLIDPFGILNSVGELDDSDLSVFPVPAHDQLTITGLPARATLQLFSPDGRLVRSAKPTGDTHRLPVQDLATGTYLLLVEASGERAYRRVVVE